MAILPPSSDFNGSTRTEGDQKTFINSLRDFLAGLLGTAGTISKALQTLKVIFATISAKTSAYTVVATDQGLVINATGTWTLSSTAAATLGAGFCFAVRNSGAGVITFDPPGAETVDGAATFSITSGVSCILVSDGTSWITIGKGSPEFSSNVSITSVSPYISMIDSDNAISRYIYHDNGDIGFLDSLGQWAAFFYNNKDAKVVGNFYVGNSGALIQTDGNIYMPCRGQWLNAVLDFKVSTDNGHNKVGSLCFAVNTSDTTILAGGTISGSSLEPAEVGYDGSILVIRTVVRSVLSGTWRCLGYCEGSTTKNMATIWQKIAA